MGIAEEALAAAEEADPPLPQQLGDYAVEGVLGEGGFGIVYAVRREGRPLALKVLRHELDLSASEQARFLKEAEALAALAHPSIVRLVDHGRLEDGRPFIAMERLNGDVLAERVDSAPLPQREALRLFGQLADAVAAMHDSGLVHRDIKPENIMLVDDDERAVLLDLGIAKGVAEGPSTTTQAGRVRGTPAYMAPERFYGTPASVKTDLYELALVLYLMLLGQLPWTDASDPVARHHPIPPANLGLSRALSDIVLDALSVDAKRRPVSVRAFARAVVRIDEAGQSLSHVTTAAVPFRVVGDDGFPSVTPSRRELPRERPSAARAPVTPDVTPPPASSLVALRPEAPAWRAPLVAAMVAALLASLPWLWLRGTAEPPSEAGRAASLTAPVAPPTASDDVDLVEGAASSSASTTIVSAPSASAGPRLASGAAPSPSTSPPPPGGLAIVPLGPEGSPAPPAPWCDRYIALRCSPDAQRWSPSGCAGAKSVVAQNGALYGRLADKDGHDRICHHQYDAEKSSVARGIADMKDREAVQAERARQRAERDAKAQAREAERARANE